MRIINSKKFAASFNELYDYVDDDTVETLDQYEQDDYDIVDYDTLETGEVPITDDNVDDVLVDNLINEYGEEGEGGVSTEEFPLEEVPIEEVPTVVEPLKEVPTEEEVAEQETPEAEESVPNPEDDAKKHFGRNIKGALEWAQEKKRVVQIFYNTTGEKRGRGGKRDLKRELNLPKIDGGGVNINRIIEPHYFFHAETTKRDILVTYDRSVRHIRAFIVDNITDYNFTKKRGSDEDQYFGKTNRPGIKVPIDTKPIKRINKMKNINDSLTEMEAALKSKRLVKSASVVKNAGEILKSIKTAQYVGVQGYWIRNRRCWDNCYRQKRTTQPGTPAQEVWMECWDEYREALNDPKSGWEKYAKRNKDMKISAKKEKQLNNIFASHVSKKVKKGMSTPEAVYTIIGERSNIQKDKILESSAQLMELADTLSSSDEKELGDKLADISANMLKEAGIWQGMKNLGKGIADMWGGKKKDEPADIGSKINDIAQKAMDLAEKIRQNISYTGRVKETPVGASSKKIVIEAKKIQKEAAPPPGGKNPFPITDPKTLNRIREEQATSPTEEQADVATAEEAQKITNEQVAQQGMAEQVGQVEPTSQPVSPEIRQTINSVNSIAYQADQLATWLATNIPIDHPNRAGAEAAMTSLQKSAREVRNFTASENINNEGTAQKLEELAQNVTAALPLVGVPPESAPSAPSGQIAAPAGQIAAPAGQIAAPAGQMEVADQASTNVFPTFNLDSDIQNLKGDPIKYDYLKKLIDQMEAKPQKQPPPPGK